MRIAVGFGFVQLCYLWLDDLALRISALTDSHAGVRDEVELSLKHRLRKFTGLIPHLKFQDHVRQAWWTPVSLYWGDPCICRIVGDIEAVDAVVICISLEYLRQVITACIGLRHEIDNLPRQYSRNTPVEQHRAQRL